MTTRLHCFVCKHLLEGGVPDTESGLGGTKIHCEAFPNGIPDAILDGGFDHRKRFKGDKGIRFELKEGIELP